MGRLEANFENDLLQTLNICLQERASELEAALKPDGKGFFVHSPASGEFEVRSLAGPIANFRLKELWGCCGVMVSHNAHVADKLQNKGVGAILLSVRMDAVRRHGYGQMLATVLHDNTAERKILAEAGWRLVGEFRNPRTNRIVCDYLANL